MAIALKGVTDSRAYAELMSALITDLITESMSPQISNAVCNASGKLLKVVEMQYKYGSSGKPVNFPLINLAPQHTT